MTFAKNLEKEMKKQNRKKPKTIKIKSYEFYWYWTPIAIPVVGINMVINYISNKYYDSLVWSDERAKKVVDYTLPKFIDEDEDGKLWFYTGWSEYDWTNRCKRKDKEWARKFRYDLHAYVETKYEAEGYEKVVDTDKYETYKKWVCFIKK